MKDWQLGAGLRASSTSFQGDGNILYLDWSLGYMTIQLSKLTKCTLVNLLHLKYALNKTKTKKTQSMPFLS